MICQVCRTGAHNGCRGGTWCACQHLGFVEEVPAAQEPAPASPEPQPEPAPELEAVADAEVVAPNVVARSVPYRHWATSLQEHRHQT